MATTRTVSQEVLRVIEAATITEDRVILPNTQLDRGLYLEVAKVLSAYGGKWNRKAQAHLFDTDPRDALADVLESSTYENQQQKFQDFPTPTPVIKRMLHAAGLHPHMLVLEPSAGKGAIVDACLAADTDVEFCEIQDKYVAPLCERGAAFLCHNFLDLEPRPIYDRVLMNPPFTKGQDVQHIQHAFQFLKPRGRLISVASAGIVFREDTAFRQFRENILCHGSYESLPEHAFRTSGTDVHTVLITINR